MLKAQNEAMMKPLNNQDNFLKEGLEVIPEIPDVTTPAYENLEEAEIFVQSAFRGFLVRKEMENRIKAAVTIQRYVRGYQCVIIYKSINEAIVCIQAFYRGYRQRKLLSKV